MFFYDWTWHRTRKARFFANKLILITDYNLKKIIEKLHDVKFKKKTNFKRKVECQNLSATNVVTLFFWAFGDSFPHSSFPNVNPVLQFQFINCIDILNFIYFRGSYTFYQWSIKLKELTRWVSSDESYFHLSNINSL